MDKERKQEILTKKSEILKIIAHPMRLCILNCLIESTCNVTTLVNAMNVPQSTVSQHLSKLRTAGIIVGTRNGLEINYKVVNTDVVKIIKMFVHDDIETLHLHNNIG